MTKPKGWNLGEGAYQHPKVHCTFVKRVLTYLWLECKFPKTFHSDVGSM